MKGFNTKSFKMGGKVPTNNATQMTQSIMKGLTGSGAKHLNKGAQRRLTQSVRNLSKAQKSTSHAAIEGLRDTAVSLGTTYAASEGYRAKQESNLARQALGNNSAYEKALDQWNGLINLSPSDPYVQGSEGETSGNKTTGSALGGY